MRIETLQPFRRVTWTARVRNEAGETLFTSGGHGTEDEARRSGWAYVHEKERESRLPKVDFNAPVPLRSHRRGGGYYR